MNSPNLSAFYADVVDGDTLRDVRSGTEIRLYGADACDFSQRAFAFEAVHCLRDPACTMLIKWTADRPISCRARSKDRCGRVLATCSFDEVPDLQQG
ncbi:hypothetical protein [Mesorhizobium sp. WSM2239]|uniref:Uncharacterized protein n=2 Tax=unclassified Mesorhizobium TaxID=325217 RepID=A0AAU8DIL6_9HYPH